MAVTEGRYAEYMAAIAGRNHVVLLAAYLSLAVLTLVICADRIRPGIGRWVGWLLAVGGFYASLVALGILWIAGYSPD